MNIFQQILFLAISFLLSLLPATTYVEGVVGQPVSFLPGVAVTQNDKTVSSLIYRGLFKYDIYGELVPDLADKWEISADGITYKIKLKNNQYWSNGRKISSNDVIYTAFKLPDLAGVATDRIDELTVNFTLPNKFSPFLTMLTVGIMPENAVEAKNYLMPVSSGSFRIVRVEKSGKIVQQLMLLNNDPSLSIRKLIFRYYVNEEELIVGAQLGEVDGFVAQDNPKLQNFAEYKFPIQGVYYALFFNLRGEKYKDVELRRALEKVLPTKDLALDEGITVQGAISRSSYTDREVEFEKFDKDFSQKLKAEVITLTVPNVALHVAMAEEIKNILEDKLEVDVELRKIDPKEIVAKIVEPRNFEILFYGQEISRDPDRYINWHSTQKDHPGLNLSGLEHVRADRALEEGRNEVDAEKRKVHYNEFQKVVADQVPAIFLYHPFAKYYVNKYVEGIGQKYTFSLGDRFLDFYNWKRVKTV